MKKLLVSLFCLIAALCLVFSGCKRSEHPDKPKGKDHPTEEKAKSDSDKDHPADKKTEEDAKK